VVAGAITFTGDGSLQVRVLVPSLVGRAVGVGLVFPVLAPLSGQRLFSAVLIDCTSSYTPCAAHESVLEYVSML
jgi:hypothetical protein